jgi:hypothetical protein
MNARNVPSPTPWNAPSNATLVEQLEQAAETERTFEAWSRRAAEQPALALRDGVAAELAAVGEAWDEQIRTVGAAVYAAWKSGTLPALLGALASPPEPGTAEPTEQSAAPPSPPRSRFQTIVVEGAQPKRSLSVEDLVRHQGRAAGGADAQERRATRHRAQLRAWLDALGPIQQPLSAEAASAEVDGFERRFDEALAAWALLPPAYNRLFTSYLTKRLRAAQGALVAGGEPHAERLAITERLIRALSKHSKDTEPGFVHGLALRHEPELGSWLDDAKAEAEAIESIIREEH